MELFFSIKLKNMQRYIAKVINVDKPKNITFAPNTHELLFRLITCFDLRKNINILTTDSEFHSFNRQVNRLNEWDNINITKVPVEPIENFHERFLKESLKKDYDIVFLSQVFFNSGHSINSHLEDICLSVSTKMFIIDGYHGYMALPTSLKNIQNKVFYLAGSYKYAQGGEGLCFLYSPPNNFRPLYTGWFASFDSLESQNEDVLYSEDGFKFSGSTIDFTALYRALSVHELFERENITVEQIFKYTKKLQQVFIEKISELNHPHINNKYLQVYKLAEHGNFLSYEIQTSELCQQIYEELRLNNIITDYRNNILRFGFSLYLDENDIKSIEL